MSDPQSLRTFLSCSAVARKLGLSRQRFWQLRKDGVFPQPQIDKETARQFYTDDQLELCVDLRRRNVGLNGKVVLFYSARSTPSVPKPSNKKRKKKQTSGRHQSIIEALRNFGLSGVNEDQIDEAIGKMFPSGTEGAEQGEVVRQVFLYLQRQNSSR